VRVDHVKTKNTNWKRSLLVYYSGETD